MSIELAVTGATGLLGPYVLHEAKRAGHAALGFGGPKSGFDLTNAPDLGDPRIVIHCAALSAMADCARDPARARALNVDAVVNLAAAAPNARIVHVSTDHVFDGAAAPYSEQASPSPLSVYGLTKWQAERVVLERPNSLVVRLALLFGPTMSARSGFFDAQLAAFAAGNAITLFDDEWRTPLSLRAAGEALVALAESSATGIVHLGGPERMSRYEMGQRLAAATGHHDARITRGSRTSVAGEPRPRDLSLDSRELHRLFPALATDTFEDECARLLAR